MWLRKKILIKKFFKHNTQKTDFLKKSSKILYPLFKPPPKFGEILVIGGLRQRV